MYRDENRIEHEELPCDEMLLNVCLEEVLSGQGPPDLSARIFSELQAGVRDAQANTAEPPPVAPPVAPPPVQPITSAQPIAQQAALPLVQSRAALRKSQAPQHQWLATAIATCTVLLIAGLGLIAKQSFEGADGSIETANAELSERRPAPKSANRTLQTVSGPTRALDREERLFSKPLFGAALPKQAGHKSVPWPLPYSVEPQSDETVIRFVNAQTAAATSLNPGSADDDAWCRRAFQQLLGRAPLKEELIEFISNDSSKKRDNLVDQILSGKKYRQEFAVHWANDWANDLLGPATSKGNKLASRKGLKAYLTEALLSGKRYDQLTQELLTATGTNRLGDKRFNGAVNFVLSGIDGKRTQIAAKVGHLFLGRQAQCAQCHDATNGSGEDLSQQQFWQLAAFFQQSQPRRTAGGAVQLADADFVGPTGDTNQAEIFYDTLEQQRKIAYPVFIHGQRVNPSGRVTDVNRREVLARMIVASEEFSRAAVVRHWRKLLASGNSTDGIAALSDELVHPLAEQFAAAKFDQRRLLRWIVLSAANAGDSSQQDRYEAPLYASAASALEDISRRGRPVEMGDLVLFARKGPNFQDPHTGELSLFVPAPADNSSHAPSLPEFVSRIAASDMTFAGKVEHVFLHALVRRPLHREMAAANRTLSAKNGNVTAAIQDIWWAVTNSGEFVGR